MRYCGVCMGGWVGGWGGNADDQGKREAGRFVGKREGGWMHGRWIERMSTLLESKGMPAWVGEWVVVVGGVGWARPRQRDRRERAGVVCVGPGPPQAAPPTPARPNPTPHPCTTCHAMSPPPFPTTPHLMFTAPLGQA